MAQDMRDIDNKEWYNLFSIQYFCTDIHISHHILQLWCLGLLAYLSTVMPRQIHCALGHSEPINHQL